MTFDKDSIFYGLTIDDSWTPIEDWPLPQNILDKVNSISIEALVAIWTNGDRFVAVTDDGGYYKVNARYMVWSNDYAVARWSDETMVEAIDCIMKQKPLRHDPNYQT